jgi:hypothetical protein
MSARWVGGGGCGDGCCNDSEKFDTREDAEAFAWGMMGAYVRSPEGRTWSPVMTEWTAKRWHRRIGEWVEVDDCFEPLP